MSILAQAGAALGSGLLRTRFWLKQRTGTLGPLEIIPYRGYGTRDEVHLMGRVVEHKNVRPAQEEDSFLQNMTNMYRRFTRMPIPGALVRAGVDGRAREVRTDGQGYFRLSLSPFSGPVNSLWQHLPCRLLEPLPRQDVVQSTGEILVPPEGAQHVVISDIDDTVLPTKATSLLRMLLSLTSGNARTRLPFPGVAAFYRALHLGPDESPLNPVLYVSRGPWNLYELLSEFFNLHDIPVGPLLYLRDWGLSREGLRPAAPRGHKYRLIASMLRAYDDLPFILIGDSGQKDPEIYTEVIRDFPGRIQAVYIREVTFDPDRMQGVEKLAKKAAETGAAMVLAADTKEMAAHAADKGWIEKRRLADIAIEKIVGEEPPDILGKKE
ncbi:MAG: App1 family protein [Desulfovibrionales bacterium]